MTAPWQGDPRINIQISKGKAKAYQVDQVIEALIRLKNDKELKMLAKKQEK